MNRLIRPAAYGAGLTVLWLGLAWLNDGITYHLAPLLVSLVVPVGVSFDRDAGRSHVLIGSAVGVGLVLAATGVLGALDRLGGPTIRPFDSVPIETILLAVGGAVVGFVLAGINLARR
ncbi:hypothetical protein HQ535_12235 [bacterium]|nr:hypothetical protein [bacterium]